MSKRIIVHIGTIKTGSTSLQHFFMDNVERCRKNDICFPIEWINTVNTNRDGRTSGHSKILAALRSNDPVKYQEIRQYIDDSGCTNIVISSENLSAYPEFIQPLAVLLDEYDVNIIVYLRRQDLFLESAYKEFVSGGWRKYSLSISEFYHSQVIDGVSLEYNYDELLMPWADAFGVQNIIVRPFEPGQFYKKELIRDFFHALDFPWDERYVSSEGSYKNISISSQFNKVMLDLNKIPLRGQYYRAVLDAYFQNVTDNVMDNEKQQNECFSSPKMRHSMLENYRESNLKVAKEYLGRNNGKLFFNDEPKPDEKYSPVRIKDANLVSELYSESLSQLSIQNNAELNLLKDDTCKLTDELKSLRAKNLNQSIAIWLNARAKIRRRLINLFRSEVKLIKRSALFDVEWYIDRYLKKNEAESDPVKHYVKKGAALGYNPSSTFDTFSYIQCKSKVMNSGINPFVSYILNCHS